MNDFSLHTNGKLLLTGEYFVTEGAVALALPTKLGQSMKVMPLKGTNAQILQWQSYDDEKELWFEAEFALQNFEITGCSEDEGAELIAQGLQDILLAARRQNPHFLQQKESVCVETYLEFPRAWGLGSSSTLVAMVAKWAGVDAFKLLDDTFGGSGYDVAAATCDQPILYQKYRSPHQDGAVYRWDVARFSPEFKDNLYFVYLGKKQNSREALVYYTVTPADERHKSLPRITQITHDINAYTKNLADFEALLAEHEELVKSVVKQPRAKELYFNDFWGEVKSLGAWGGDFVLATSDRSEAETKAYFRKKGFATVFNYSELIKE